MWGVVALKVYKLKRVFLRLFFVFSIQKPLTNIFGFVKLNLTGRGAIDYMKKESLKEPIYGGSTFAKRIIQKIENEIDPSLIKFMKTEEGERCSILIVVGNVEKAKIVERYIKEGYKKYKKSDNRESKITADNLFHEDAISYTIALKQGDLNSKENAQFADQVIEIRIETLLAYAWREIAVDVERDESRNLSKEGLMLIKELIRFCDQQAIENSLICQKMSGRIKAFFVNQ